MKITENGTRSEIYFFLWRLAGLAVLGAALRLCELAYHRL